jgi:ATP-dependent exoDNAse (exonuclease V) beta subunit
MYAQLVDFKTSKIPEPGKDIRKENIDLQFDLYALAAEKDEGKYDPNPSYYPYCSEFR